MLPEATQERFIRERLPRGPPPYPLVKIFGRRGTPFVYLCIENWCLLTVSLLPILCRVLQSKFIHPYGVIPK